MKYISPNYEKMNIASKDVACISFDLTTYEEDGDTVQKIDFSFTTIFNQK
jgi:hypothetical protein